MSRVPVLVLLSVAVVGCRADSPGERRAAGALAAAHAEAIGDSVRALMSTVSNDIARGGPVAWLPHFVRGREFFMVSEGELVFPSPEVADRFVKAFAPTIRQIEITWNGDIRVDALAPGLAMIASPYHEVRTDTAGHRSDETGYFTGLAEHRGNEWQLRDAHWSVKAAAK
ncbi:MAG: hypothetical protein ABJD07_07060 [Gemmatimonadaceae bacterium]